MSDQATISSNLTQTPSTSLIGNNSDEIFVNANEESLDLDEYFRSEQSKINAGLNFLLNFDPTKRKQGRPPKDIEGKVKQIPESINPNLRAFTNINELHPGVLIDHLVRVNSLNQKILNSFNALNEKYQELDIKYNKSHALFEKKGSRSTSTNEVSEGVSHFSEDKTLSSDVSQSKILGVDEL